MAKRSWEPKAFQIRDPRTTKSLVGRVVNPPRALKIGGRGENTLYSVEPNRTNQGTESPSLKVTDRGKGDGSPI